MGDAYLVPIVNIVDIINIKRTNEQLKTYNKEFYILSCRINGESIFTYNNCEHKVNTGDILYIPHGANYTQRCENEEIICFHLKSYGSMPKGIHISLCDNSNEICALFKEAYSLWCNRTNGYDLRCMSILYRILSMCDAFKASPYENSTVERALNLLETDIFDTDFSLSGLCEKIGISKTYLNKICHDKFSCNTITHINSERIKKAKFLLKCGGYINDEIAQICGFSTTKYFYNTFKKVANMTTKEYKKSVQ